MHSKIGKKRGRGASMSCGGNIADVMRFATEEASRPAVATATALATQSQSTKTSGMGRAVQELLSCSTSGKPEDDRTVLCYTTNPAMNGNCSPVTVSARCDAHDHHDRLTIPTLLYPQCIGHDDACEGGENGDGGDKAKKSHHRSRFVPALEYTSRRWACKTAIHWGQRKLLLSELQLFVDYALRSGLGATDWWVVYAGSAPGTHLALLDDLLSWNVAGDDSGSTAGDGRRRVVSNWELVDPGMFDKATLGPRKNFTLRMEFFTNATAYSIVERRIGAKFPAIARLYNFLWQQEAHAQQKETVSGTAASDVMSGASNGTVIRSQLEQAIGERDVARCTNDIPSMYEAPVPMPVGLRLLTDAAMHKATPRFLFVCDIRSGSVDMDNFELHVKENMAAQQCWTEIMQPAYSMLKYRLPYTSLRTNAGRRRENGSDGDQKKGDDYRKRPAGGAATGSSSCLSVGGTLCNDTTGITEYLRGDVLLPIWTRPTSTEARLVVPRGAQRIPYSNKEYEDRFYYFNAVVRELIHFNHPLLPLEPASNGSSASAAAGVNRRRHQLSWSDAHEHLDAHYDSAAEANVLLNYIDTMRRGEEELVRGRRVGSSTKYESESSAGRGHGDCIVTKARTLCNKISASLGQSFADSIAKRNNIVFRKAAAENWEDQARRIAAVADAERSKPSWWSHVRSSEDLGNDVTSGVACEAAQRVNTVVVEDTADSNTKTTPSTHGSNGSARFCVDVLKRGMPGSYRGW